MKLQQMLDAVSRDPWSGRLSISVAVVLVLLIGRDLASLTWSILAPETVSSPAAAAWVTAAPSAVDPERVAERHLFGRSDGAPITRTVDAPDTSLNLTLRGIAAANQGPTSRALIAGPDGVERVYANGATVPGGATVHEILADRVLLSRRGTLETLRLPRHGSPAPAPRTAAAPTPSTTSGSVDNLQDLAGSEQLADLVRPQAVLVDGQVRGYRLYPGRNRQRFASMGLRAGDLVTAVNGMPLDGSTSFEALNELLGSEQVTLTIERGGQIETLTLRADQ